MCYTFHVRHMVAVMTELGRQVETIVEHRSGNNADTQNELAELGSGRASKAPPPTLWLLGKTGAGKSSLIARAAGEGVAEIGDGIAPCTRGISVIELPPKEPVLRLMDTRGLGEVGYDATQDIAACSEACDAVLIVARLDDPVQAAVAEALRVAQRRRPSPPVVLSFTASDLVDNSRQPASRAAILSALGLSNKTPMVSLSLSPDTGWEESGMSSLLSELENILPELSSSLSQRNAREVERAAFDARHPMVLRRAGMAAAADGVPLPLVGPIVGSVAVIPIQVLLLRDIARSYGVLWTKARIIRLGAALGAGTTARIGLGLLARQAAKLIPIAGQTVGALGAAAMSFAVTYALGRVAARFLHGEATGHAPSSEDLRAHFIRSLGEIADRIKRGEVNIQSKKGQES